MERQYSKLEFKTETYYKNEGTQYETKNRYLCVYLSVNGSNAEKKAEHIIKGMENELKEYGFTFARCPEITRDTYVDTLSIEFEMGRMAEYKEAVRQAYKVAKEKKIISNIAIVDEPKEYETVEWCSNCEEEVIILADNTIKQICPVCGEKILACSICDIQCEGTCPTRDNIPVKKITGEEAVKVIEDRKNLGLFYLKEGNTFIGIDNENGHAWTEEFDTIEACINWLIGADQEEDQEEAQDQREKIINPELVKKINADIIRTGRLVQGEDATTYEIVIYDGHNCLLDLTPGLNIYNIIYNHQFDIDADEVLEFDLNKYNSWGILKQYYNEL